MAPGGMRFPTSDVDQQGSDQSLLRDVDQCHDQGPSSSCWICLGDAADGPLRSFCACPDRLAHDRCLGRWCLQQAGRDEERNCRFCKTALPDYRDTLTGGDTRKSAANAKPLPNIRVHCGNRIVVMPLYPGEQGKRDFEAGVRQLLNLPADQPLNINFQCREPGADAAHPNSRVHLSGLGTYDAAFWCASHTAAERQQQQHQQQLQQSLLPQPQLVANQHAAPQGQVPSQAHVQSQPQRAASAALPKLPKHPSQAQVLRMYRSSKPSLPPSLQHAFSAPAGLSAPLLHGYGDGVAAVQAVAGPNAVVQRIIVPYPGAQGPSGSAVVTLPSGKKKGGFLTKLFRKSSKPEPFLLAGPVAVA